VFACTAAACDGIAVSESVKPFTYKGGRKAHSEQSLCPAVYSYCLLHGHLMSGAAAKVVSNALNAATYQTCWHDPPDL
jgi:hypothetical protein